MAVEHEEAPYPPVDDLERFYDHLEQTLLATGFIRPNHPGQGDEQAASSVHPRASGKPGVEHPARHAGVY